MTIAMLLRNTLGPRGARRRRPDGRLRAGEWLAGAAALLLLVVAVPRLVRRARAPAGRRSACSTSCWRCSRWSRSRWSPPQATRQQPGDPGRAVSVLTTLAGALAALLILYRIVNQPGPNALVERRGGRLARPRGGAAVAAGGWRSMRVEAMPGRRAPAGRGPSRARSVTRSLARAARAALHFDGRTIVSTLGIVLLLAGRRARGGGGARAVARRARRRGARVGRRRRHRPRRRRRGARASPSRWPPASRAGAGRRPATRGSSCARRSRVAPHAVRSGAEGLVGRVGEVRAAPAPWGRCSWTARCGARGCGRPTRTARCERGDPIVVERVDGLTLTVRRAEEWEVAP